MKISVIGFMKSHLDNGNIEVNNENMPKILEELKRLAGAEAGICYMSKPYFDSYVSDPEKALKRFSVADTGHHSIAGHSQISLLLEGVPKIIAMYLNNLKDYETSEKSGRYTVMTGNTPLEVELYDKWCEKFRNRIVEVYGDKIDEKTVDKLAKENARYLLSVFTPTTMGYTASLRQFNYIIDWAEKFVESDTPDNYFFNELKKYFKEFGAELKSLLYVEELRDYKNRFGFDMISSAGDIECMEDVDVEEHFGKFYNIAYPASFAEYAQAQRHRTLNYNIYFDGVSKLFYTPPIIENTPLETEWLQDMESVAEYIPNGTIVVVEESGKLEHFFLKSMERNCGRAQLEIMNMNIDISCYFYENLEKFSEKEQALIKSYFIKDEPKMKGQMLKCKEPCVWGCNGAKCRLI